MYPHACRMSEAGIKVGALSGGLGIPPGSFAYKSHCGDATHLPLVEGRDLDDASPLHHLGREPHHDEQVVTWLIEKKKKKRECVAPRAFGL